jgi:class 3 adenylate cyclase
MNPETPAPGPTRSQRSLAAIVFTDVVSFSARMHADEVGTLKLLERDFAAMRALCAEYEGEVLKTTGDGLLLTFASAVQAVACALAMQRKFAAGAKDPTPGGALQHRIGIHLGDVLVQDKDVMGDGVNIASRLQAEAEPGGICISQTVYDVVKNKLAMQVVSLGARELKNISSAMPVYRLLLEAQALDPAPHAAVPVAARSGPRKRPTVVVAGVALALLLAAAAVVVWRRAPAHAQPAAPPAMAAAPTPLGPAAAPAGTPAPSPAVEAANRRDLMIQMHTLYLDTYDFNGMVRALRERGENPAAPLFLQQTLRAGEQLVRMKVWVEGDLRHHSAKHPLVAHAFGGVASGDESVYLAEDGRVALLENGVPHLHDWADLKPRDYGAIVVGALREAKETPRPVVLGAQAFARMYSLPAMVEALDAMKAKAPAANAAGP